MHPGSNGPQREPDATDAGARWRRETRPFFERLDEEGLCAHLRARWPRHRLTDLLEHADPEVASTAAICLGLAGTFDDTAALARSLHHDDYFVVSMAERSLWSIWLRSSTDGCHTLLRSAIDCIHRPDCARAESLLDEILVKDPDFAEACNQRAVLYFLIGRFELSIIACHRALALNRFHFGAAAGLGHNHFQLGDYQAATAAYRRALQLHPRLEGVRQALRRIREVAPVRSNEITLPQAPQNVLSLKALARDTDLVSR